MKREYALITRASVFWSFIAIPIVYMVIGLAPSMMLVSANQLGQYAQGPCFYCRNCDSPETAGKYSGYSTIVPNVWQAAGAWRQKQGTHSLPHAAAALPASGVE